MTCDQIGDILGPFIDDELDPRSRAEVEEHLVACADCRRAYQALRQTVAIMVSVPAPSEPVDLWSAIEQRLDQRDAALHRRARVLRFRRRFLAAAVIVFAVGLGSFATFRGFRGSGSDVADASTIDFSLLLDALPLDPGKAFRRFLMRYHAKPSTPAEVQRLASGLNFALPDALPGGYQLGRVYSLRFGDHVGVAAEYHLGAEFIVVVFHRPIEREDFGTYRDYRCVIGKHHGHKVQVGDWKMVHLTDPTTCHGVLSRLDERTQLPAILSAIAPEPAPGERRATEQAHRHSPPHDHD